VPRGNLSQSNHYVYFNHFEVSAHKSIENQLEISSIIYVSGFTIKYNLINKMMRTYCLAIMLPIMMVSLTVTDHPTYSAYVTVKNPSGFTHFLAPTNMTFSMLYGNTSNLASVYTPTWKPLDI